MGVLALLVGALGIGTTPPDTTDGRYTLAILTDDGWEVVAAAPGHVETVPSLVFHPLTRAPTQTTPHNQPGA